MNGLEQRFAVFLQERKLAGEIEEWRFEAVKFRIGEKCFYTADFMVVESEQITFYETKGFWEDDARVKIKAVAALFPWFRFVGVKFERGEWKLEEIGIG
jgi:hypothetical protein